MSYAPGPGENETNASEESAAAWAPGPSWDPFYDAQSTDDNIWNPWPDSVDGPQDDPEGEPGSSGTATTDGGGSGSTDRTSTDGTGGSDTTSSGSDDGSGTEATGSDTGTDDSGPEDSDDTGSLVNDTVTPTTENTSETLNSTTGNGSTLDTNLSG